MSQSTIIDWLEKLESQIASESIPRARTLWGGADVVISESSAPISHDTGFYPDPRRVSTSQAHELSWLFENLRDAFYSEGRIDYYTKIEFFGRLANAANRALGKDGELDARNLCAAVLHEAFAIYEELEEGTFQTLPLAIGNEIADDYVDEARKTGFVGIEETKKFFAERGIELDES